MSFVPNGHILNSVTVPEDKSFIPSSLLRLFQSQFFDIRLAIQYLHLYPNKVGVQHYITAKLLEFPEEDVSFFMSQFCHLMLTRPKQSAAIEDLLVQMSFKSHHFVILLFYYLETYLSDLKATPFSAANVLCQSLYRRCKFILGLTVSAGNDESLDSFDSKAANRISDTIAPAIVAFGCGLATIGTPLMMHGPQQIIVKEGQRLRRLKQFLKNQFKKRTENTNQVSTESFERSASAVSLPIDTKELPAIDPFHLTVDTPLDLGHARSPSLQDLESGKAFSFEKFFHEKRPSTMIRDQEENPQNASAHYFHNQLSFISSLIDISDRLVSVPKEARQSFLVAELSLLNHNLPANICLPLWCRHSIDQEFHHKVARISITDAVVLNSAEKVPYLVCFEVVNTDMSIEELVKNASQNSIVGPNGEEHKSTRNSRPVSAELPDNVHVPPAVVTNQNKAIRRLSQTLSPSSSPLESPKSLDGTHERQDGNADYHNVIRERRLSAISTLLKRPSVSPSPDSNGNYSPGYPPHYSSIDEMTEKLRTCAVMLAQLYQQQQAEFSKLERLTTSNKTGQNNTAGSPAISVSVSKKRYQSLKANFEEIRNRLVKEMMQIEEQKMKLMEQTPKGQFEVSDVSVDVLDADQEQKLHADALKKNKDDPSAAVFRESWDKKVERIRKSSPYGHLENWSLVSCIVKAGDDLRQEQIALQLIREMEKIWKEDQVGVWVYPYRVLITSENSGLVETVKNSISIHSIKKDGYARHLNQQGLTYTLYDHFMTSYGDPNGHDFVQAQDCFMRSLAAYSIISYILQLKDRHNGNLLIDTQGHIIHIDFGFMLSNSPGSVGFELSPFKMPQEYIDILGGIGSHKFEEYKALMKESFLSLRRKIDYIVGIVEIMEKDSALPCFTGGSSKPASTGTITQTGTTATTNGSATRTSNKEKAVQFPVSTALRDRFHLSYTEPQVSAFLDQLLYSSCNNMFTKLYDSFQYYSQGVF